MPYTFDDQYLQQLLAGDPAIEQHFVDYFGPLITRKLRARLRSSELIEDARQEIFLRVFGLLRNARIVKSPDSLGALVNSVCNNVILEMYRSSGRLSEFEERAPPEAVESSILESHRAQVREVLESLPPKDREILRALFVEEHDREDVAHTFGVSPDYLRVLVHRAKQRFRSSLIPSGRIAPEPPAPEGAIPVGTIPSRKRDHPEPVRFTVYHPAELVPEVWKTLLTYIHVPAAMPQVEKDCRRLLGLHSPGSTGCPTRTIARGAEIIVVPHLPGCEFNPARLSVRWLEDWHRLDFRVQASRHFAGSAVNGIVSFYVGPILVGEVAVWAHIGNPSQTSAVNDQRRRSEDPYEFVFVSYAREDVAIVEKLETAYEALGIEYLRDVKNLRSGDEWSPALLRLIAKADIFQLCWSSHASASKFVEREWRHALKRKQPSFIRPVYWETPMPPPPRELSRLHFAYLEW